MRGLLAGSGGWAEKGLNGGASVERHAQIKGFLSHIVGRADFPLESNQPTKGPTMTPREFAASTSPVAAMSLAAEETALSAADPAWDLCPYDLLGLRIVAHRDFEARPAPVVVLVFTYYALIAAGFMLGGWHLRHLTQVGVEFSPTVAVLVLVTAWLGIFVLSRLWLEASVALNRVRARRKLASLTRDCRVPVLRRDLAPDDQVVFDGLAARVCIHPRHGEDRRRALADLFTFATARTTHHGLEFAEAPAGSPGARRTAALRPPPEG